MRLNVISYIKTAASLFLLLALVIADGQRR